MTFAPCRQNRKRARPSLLQAVMARNYAGPNGTIFVGDGLGGDSYMTFWRKDSGALCRVKSKILPTRKTFAQAQQDLDAYAKCRRLPLVGGSDRTPEARAADQEPSPPPAMVAPTDETRDAGRLRGARGEGRGTAVPSPLTPHPSPLAPHRGPAKSDDAADGPAGDVFEHADFGIWPAADEWLTARGVQKRDLDTYQVILDKRQGRKKRVLIEIDEWTAQVDLLLGKFTAAGWTTASPKAEWQLEKTLLGHGPDGFSVAVPVGIRLTPFGLETYAVRTDDAWFFSETGYYNFGHGFDDRKHFTPAAVEKCLRAALAEHLVAAEKKRKKELKMPKTKSPAKKRAAPTAPKRPKKEPVEPANIAGQGQLQPVALERRKGRKEPVEPANIGVDDIVPSPFQPRGPESFPEAEIEALAQSIAGQGQLQPVVLRRLPDADGRARYELVDGERRWRAVQRLKWHTIRAEVQRHSDAEARAAVLASAIHHKDLNAIEEARAMKAAIDAGDAKGPTQLAKMLGVSQGHVSNRLRLLTVPDDWQARVISGEITERHARAVVPHIRSAGLLADASDLLAARRMTAEEFEAAVAMLAKGTLRKKGARGEGRGAREEDAPQKRAGRFAPATQYAGDPSKFAEGLLAGRRDPMKVPPPAAAAPDEEPDDLAAAWDAGKWDRELAKLDKYIRGIAERWPEVPEIRNALAQRLRHMARELTLS